MTAGDEADRKQKLSGVMAPTYEEKLYVSNSSKLQLKCKDGTTLDVTYEQAMMSSTLWVLLQEKDPKIGLKQHIIPMFDVPTESVQCALDYCSCLYKQQVDRVDTVMLDWENEFISLDSKELCDLAKVASNLDIQPLVDLTCRSITQIMSATTEADELRKKFGLQEPSDVENSCELRSDMAGFDFDMFNTLDHDLSTEEYGLVEIDQPSVDELVTFINGSGSHPNATPSQLQQHQAVTLKNTCQLHGENGSDSGNLTNGSKGASKKKRRKHKKKKVSQRTDQVDTKSSIVINKCVKRHVASDHESSSSDEKEELNSTLSSSSRCQFGNPNRPWTLEEKVQLARQNPSAVFEESQFEDDDDEDMAKMIKMFELNLESAYQDCDRKEKPRLEFAPREVFRSSLGQSSQFEFVQRRISATMT
ncbi:hypothetical protein CCR75_000460 [Bremia lactucae]|uniref:SKP1 component dimerisation domain-containing protein n=1 Tax=Bremia lactucae TaxID=4779 RepID=A0A976FLV7_BRELC|nr:hypothetical protein CCR75_000460 [Bremia lactucae]